MVEEMIDFKRSIEAVIDWVGAHGGWKHTLLIITADHDLMLWGPHSDSVPFDPLQDNGPGRLPSYRWLSRSHSNALVPVYARGVGAETLVSFATAEDPFYGPYLGHPDIFHVIKAVLSP
jgi:alkaline phosphatase